MSTEQIVRELNSTIGNFVSKVSVEVNDVDTLTRQVRSTADNAYEEIKNFRQNMIENEQMQMAHENVLRINQIIRERFSEYDAIRRTTLGVIRDCDINLVRNKTIQELSEELWITSSRYWLSYTLISISAWVNDNKSLCKNALSESYRVDKVKTSLFFCLMNLRFNRKDVTREWLLEYLSTIVPENIDNETAILIQAYINGVFGVDKELEYIVKGIVDKWIEQININDESASALSNMFLRYLNNLPTGSKYKCDYINAYCKNANELPYSYLEATKYDLLIERIKQVDVENVVQNPNNFKQRIDLILTDLITNYDKEELELKREQEFFELIIANKGKEDVAEKQYQEINEQRNKLQSIGEKCVEWALYNHEQVDIHVQKFAYQNTKTWYLNALNEWSKAYEEKFVSNYEIEIEDWSCISNGEDAAIQEMSLKEHLEKNKFKIKYVNKANGYLILFMFLTLLLGIFAPTLLADFEFNTIVMWAGYITSVILLIVLIVRIITANSIFKKKVQYALSQLNGTLVEISEYRRVYFENNDKKAMLYSLIEHL